MSRRNRTSCTSTGRSISPSVLTIRSSQLLRKLDPVAVGVEDIEQPHLTLQLEDDADLDAGRAQPVGLRFQVCNVDVGDAAVLARFPFGEPDLHGTVLEQRPALVEVDARLLEAERVAVEASPAFEVTHV